MNEHLLQLPDGTRDFEFEVGDMSTFEWASAPFNPGNYEVKIINAELKASAKGGKNIVVTVEGSCDGKTCTQRKTIVIPNGDPNSEDVRKQGYFLRRFIASIGGEGAKNIRIGMKLKAGQVVGKTGYVEVTRQWYDGKLRPQIEFISRETYEQAPGPNLEYQDPPRPMDTGMGAAVRVAMNQQTVAASVSPQPQPQVQPQNGAAAATSLVNW